ncbi:acyl-CoA dehydrogenase family protein [Altererythrobacter sp.]|uniref:acyl-CoA dehydrogenase family protein n=1 Tax=Altererythrobacter sp. TaxID=1872480 RepID=UPI001B071989|nr:acyl-CoA dehydrogenase family protein [Altererythrobacter sp.]MBO6610020.1 acyl-CoA dehydrogenase family protein [Altererythrobacter sp.]MBO6642150.1 acyl-CoA dehydrogenase family protein [Altererythrobacter sp.]MBO6709342.1 acyl-CoA dehydrogenase family protein [Altererythrobacter sp.]
MDMDFSPEDLAFRDEVRAFLKESLPEHLKDGARRTPGVFVEPDIGMEWHRILNDRGWVAYHWPKEDGGTGWTPTQKFIFEKECALAGAPAISILGLRLVGPVICEFGTPEQKARFLPRILSGEDYWCQGYSEPGSGSDLASLKTSARLEGDQYIVNGSKIWTTHAHHADWIFALVRTDSSGKKQQGITFLLIPMDQPGVEVSPILSMSGDHEVNQVFFTDAVTSVENRIGEEGAGWSIAKFLLENERGGSCYAPRLLQSIERLRELAETQPSGVNGAVAHDPRFRDRLSRARLNAEALEVTELRILADLAKGRAPGPQTSLVKLLGSNIGQEIDTLRLELLGYDALQLPVDRPLYGNEAPEPVGSELAQTAMGKYLNNRAATIFGGSDEVQKNIIAKTVLGL